MSSPEIAVVIVTYNSAAEIAACLDALALAVGELRADVVVVDCGSQDRTLRVIEDHPLRVRVHCLRNVGFAAAANLGARKTHAPHVLFLNPDARVSPEALRSLLRCFRTTARVAVVGGDVRDARGVPEPWQGGPFPSLLRAVRNHVGLSRRSTTYDLLAPRRLPSRIGRPSGLGPAETDAERDGEAGQPPPSSVPWVSGAALAVRRSALEDVGGFTERFFLYFEDVDICWRLRARGGLVVRDHGAVVTHGRGRSASAGRRRRAYDRAQTAYFQMHRPPWERAALPLLRAGLRQRARIGALLAGLAVSVGIGVLSPLWVAVVVGSLAVIIATLRWPLVGVGLLVGSLTIGQSVRLPLGDAVRVTGTDLLLPLVLVGSLLAVVARGRAAAFVRTLAVGWWVPAALLPGLVLATERLPPADIALAGGYALRLGAALLLVPVLRSLGISFRVVRNLLVLAAVLLFLIGLVQLAVLPTLPPVAESVWSTLFLSLSGGGWDPHVHRLFATWLDPNFLGGFFVMGIALILGSLLGVQRRGANGFPPAASMAQPLRAGWLLASGLVLLFALVLTQSRTAALGFCAVLLTFAIIGVGRRRLLVPLAAAVALTLLAAPAFLLRFSSPLDDPTLSLRLHSWSQAAAHVARFPLFGVGYNAYGAEQLLQGNVTDPSLHSLAGADSIVWTTLATTGLWGAVLLGGGLVWTLRVLLARFRDGDAAAGGALLVLVALFAHSQFVQSFTYLHLLVPLALVLGSSGETSSEKRETRGVAS